jgi:hypothetical protein
LGINSFPNFNHEKAKTKGNNNSLNGNWKKLRKSLAGAYGSSGECTST